MEKTVQNTRPSIQRGRQDQDSEMIEKVVQIDRVARVVKGGRRFRFRAAVVIGDGKGNVGVGVGKGKDVQSSIQKAVHAAKKRMITVPLKQRSIHHEVTVTFAGARVLLKPASEGTGVIAGGAVRAVVEAAGIHDILSKSLGSSNKLNNIQATYLALSTLSSDSKLRESAQRSVPKNVTAGIAQSTAEQIKHPETEEKSKKTRKKKESV